MLYGQIINKNLKQKASHAFILFKQSFEGPEPCQDEKKHKMSLYPVLVNNREHSDLCDMAFNWIN